MKNLSLLALSILVAASLYGQAKQKGAPARPAPLADLYKAIVSVQQDARLFVRNLSDNSTEKDVNFIVVEMEQVIDSLPRTKTPEQNLLIKHFQFLRSFFLSTNNKTAVAASFLYNNAPYNFCSYHDTSTVLYLHAIKDADIYNLAKTTEKKITRIALEYCLLPSLRPFADFKDIGIRFVALSVYVGCKDTRDGAPGVAVVPYCLTLVAPIADAQQYGAGILTAKGLLANAELYLSGPDDAGSLTRIQLNID